jgi:hypothetical protein
MGEQGKRREKGEREDELRQHTATFSCFNGKGKTKLCLLSSFQITPAV